MEVSELIAVLQDMDPVAKLSIDVDAVARAFGIAVRREATGAPDARQRAVVAAVPQDGVLPDSHLSQALAQLAERPVHSGDLAVEVLQLLRLALVVGPILRHRPVW